MPVQPIPSLRIILLALIAVLTSAFPAALAGEAEAEAKKADATATTLKPKAEKKKRDEAIDVTVVATKEAKPIFESPSQVRVHHNEEFAPRAGNNFVDVFEETPGVHVQKTGHGQGSPFIRGFTGYNNLMMIDGIRFNNSAFRAGPIQYWATVDPLFLDRVDLLRGPGSALYGSDAVGGVVNAITKSTDTWSDGTEVGGEAFYRFAMAERSHIGHVEVKGSHKDKVGWIFGGSFKDHDDFVAGGGTGLQEYTGYNEWSLNGKVEYRPLKDHRFIFYVDRVRQNDVPRTHTTIHAESFEGTPGGSDKKREFDQNRLLSYLKYKGENLGAIVDEAEVTLSYQTTIQEEFRTTGSLQNRESGYELNTLGAQVQLKSHTPIGKMTYGIDYYHDDVESFQKRYRPFSVRLQGPLGDDGFYDLFGAYIQDEVDLFDRFLTLTAGGRFEYARADADKVDNPGPGPGVLSLHDDWTSFVGSLRWVIRPDQEHGDHWRVFGGVQQSFRAPSLYDITSFDETILLEVPTSGLEPEEFTTYEIGARTRYGGFRATGSYYYTFIHNAIDRAPTGQLADPNDPLSAPLAEKRNGGKGYIQGIELELAYNFWDDFTVWGNLTYTEGDTMQFVETAGGTFKSRKPADRLIPFMSHMGFKYEPLGENWWVELHADVFSDADRLSVGNRVDSRIPPGGTPGFGVFGIRGGVKLLDEKLSIRGAIENIANTDYRIHGSGQNMPGTNFVLSVLYKW